MEVDYNFDKVCRACLLESDNMKSLFTKIEGGDRLLDILALTADIEIRSEDALPKQVCGDCESFLCQADVFKRRCKESELILKNVRSTSSPYFVKTDDDDFKIEDKVSADDLDNASTDKVDIEKPDLMSLLTNSDITFKKLDSFSDEKHDVKTEVTIEFENLDYTEDFDDREELAVPTEADDVKEIPTFKCESYSSEGNKKSAKVRRSNRKKGEDIHIPIKANLDCPKCNITLNSLSKWIAHQSTHSRDSPTRSKDSPADPKDSPIVKKVEIPRVQCSLCLRSFKNKKTLSKHIKRHETKDNVKYICVKCKREFKYKAFLESHMLSVHVNGTDDISCEDCLEKFSSRKSLEVHMETHKKKKKKNSCHFCNKSFFMSCTLKDHLRIHTGEKPFLCSICGKGFSQKNNLAQHVRRHMGVKPYKCDSCAMMFVSKGELESHTRKHTGAHPFICDECGSGFTTSSALVKHRRTHTGERPYSCDLCPMKFAATGTLKNHRRTHTGERPYQCSHCEKSFVQRSDLISHIRCHTGERPFVCPQCGQAFRKAAAMKTHVKMHSRDNLQVHMQL